jgi:hypothetical protein
MTLLVVAFLLSIVTGTCLDETSSVIWITGPGIGFLGDTYYVNECQTPLRVSQILSHYCDRGYSISHHTMTNRPIRYSWILVKQGPILKFPDTRDKKT